MVGFARDTEKKYLDLMNAGEAVAQMTGSTVSELDVDKGISWNSTFWWSYSMRSPATPQSQASNNMLKFLGTGATARLRIGNKITVKYIKGAFTIEAAATRALSGDTQHGEAIIGEADQYARTSYRVCIVKDTQINNTEMAVLWNDVFEINRGGTGALHAEMKVENMGRFIFLYDKYFVVDADDPIKTVPFWISGSRVGNVRYNGSDPSALTDKGIALIYSAWCPGVGITASGQMQLPRVKFHHRLCFTDS